VATQLKTNISQSTSKPKKEPAEKSILIEEERIDDLSAAVKKKKKTKNWKCSIEKEIK